MAEERIYNLLELDDSGEISGTIFTDDWSEREFTYVVFDDEDCKEPLDFSD